MSNEDWQPTRYTPSCCNDTIWSAYPGQYKECKCGDSFVDQTREYTRLGGEGMRKYYIFDSEEGLE